MTARGSVEAPRIVVGNLQPISNGVSVYPTDTDADELAEAILEKLGQSVTFMTFLKENNFSTNT